MTTKSLDHCSGQKCSAEFSLLQRVTRQCNQFLLAEQSERAARPIKHIARLQRLQFSRRIIQCRIPRHQFQFAANSLIYLQAKLLADKLITRNRISLLVCSRVISSLSSNRATSLIKKFLPVLTKIMMGIHVLFPLTFKIGRLDWFFIQHYF